MDKNKLYYLCHPYTTHGNMQANKQDAIETEIRLEDNCGITIINPLRLINTPDNNEAMTKCFNLLAASDAIILCKDWNLSKGCKEEVEFAINREKDIFLIENIEGR